MKHPCFSKYLRLGTYLLVLIPLFTSAQTRDFVLKDGDRVVFVGNGLFENDLQFGYLEFALTTRFPTRNIVYRNLGWSGDDVFGASRSYYTNPPTPYQLLIEQITQAQPTVVFVGYGAAEAQEGQAGVAKFKAGYNQLLDVIDQLGAQAILLSPIPVLTADAEQRNRDLQLYGNLIATVAKERNKRFIDLFDPILKYDTYQLLMDDGYQLNEAGYYFLSQVVETGLGFPDRRRAIQVKYSKNGSSVSAPAEVLASVTDHALMAFRINDPLLPFPLPAKHPELFEDRNSMTITGLKKGFYKLVDGNKLIQSGSKKAWAQGLPVTQGSSFDQSNRLIKLIMKKNELFFYQYRPLNRTYIVGFRSYEQGKHTQELDEMNVTIKWLETQIMLNSQPKPAIYELRAAE
ncbi:lysophospholipase L1-like esterase [Dyadobacter jejuensis]|uniref:Lysophospholipase L1-like esterase n=1 Tax=Dyadobacter jejuensis TaxID=1082580 RepID=A0A316AKM6_9BACT|nr:GDSL-type esterase/lipase family protein [Dyadobacter jejuensis]PWJ58176.1 lysophospholipase L1-like esterase [Dyadobacter jejuensis]